VSLTEAWEREAKAWITWARAPGHDSYWRFHRDQFFDLLSAAGRLTVDVGCGEGRLSRDLATHGHRVVGVDASPTLIAAARAADPDGDYRCADAAKLPLADGSCDLAIAFMSLQDVDDLPAAVAEIGRVLGAGGRACIAIVHPLTAAGRFVDEAANSPFVIRGTYLAEFPYTDTVSRDGLGMTFHSRHRPLEAYAKALEAAGLVIDAIREPPIPTGPTGISERSRRWQRIPLFMHLRARKLAASAETRPVA
jgi:SAM-dependent methyltransferase